MGTLKPADTLFRKAALDRLSSPEQLDRLVSITAPRSWIAFSGLVLLAVVALAWGVFGRVPTNVPAKGLLVAQGGRVQVAMSPAGGVVEKLTVSLGDVVAKGQVVAVIRQASVEQRLAGAREVVGERERELSGRREGLLRELQARKATMRQRRDGLRQSIAAARQRIGYLERQLQSRQEMLSMGFATAERIHEAQNDLNRARNELAEAQSQIVSLDAEEVQAQLEAERQITQLKDAASESRRRVDELTTEIGLSSTVVAPADGRVTELKVTDGAMVGTGEPVLSIETTGAALQAVIYIPTEQGKKVQPGMSARIAPATVKKEEFGTLRGTVITVSSFPATRQGMAAVLQNDALVETFAKQGAPYEARVDLTRADTISGYAWTSAQGPAIDLTSGTTVEVDIAVRVQPPIELVLPFLRKIVGVDR